ncbi:MULTISPECIES: sensor domain-containing diguanylate cyclase [Enterobacter]|uniref:sensor domain-containing diguanylate cyclase n=1 Tax=Enterobacter TaxID=547 RepID=UPI0003ED05AF|nr:sensor domain-containing diguanylate cyclase [Enterobacter pseudoroggenkampii]EWG66104.1 putative diguanylate cyclase YcdT [Enterobacter sp. DC3]EWG70856.1 putative diguanylate cyclase YcdT [Enterobacter sp. DC4]MCK4231085.1 GGDEF domain-containing protein [Enterobacter asburiae]
MKENRREIVNDSMQALHALAKLMPQLHAQCSLTDMLTTISRALGASLAWVSVNGDDGLQRVVCAGEMTCHPFEVADFLADTLLQRHHRSWRVVYWKENIGRALFPPQHPGYAQLHSGVLCKLSTHNWHCSGYFFLAFDERLSSLPILKNIVVVLVEKLKDYFAEIIAREKTAQEMQRVVTQYKTLFERAPVLMNSFDKFNRCVLWNAECEKVFGWTMAEIAEHADPLSLFYPDPEERRRVRESVNVSPLKDMYEWHPLRKDGTPLTVLWSNILLPDNSILNIGLDITERKKAEQQLQVKATTDDLTGCFNRSAILQQLELALAASARQEVNSHFCVLMFDLDFFKQINDEWGHPVGDAALLHFCNAIRELSPSDSALGRVGGEEFLLLLAQTNGNGAAQLSARLRTFLQTNPLAVGERKVSLSFSAGVVEVSGGQRDTSVLLRRADKALYEAKHSGRGKTVVAADYL